MTPLWNVVKAWLFLLALVAMFGAAGYAIGGFRLSSIFTFAGLLLGLSTFWAAEKAVLGMLGARELPEAADPALHSLVARLAARIGVVKPRVYVIEQGPPLALAAGRGVTSASIAVTVGLARLPVPPEVEGLIAHELAHIRNRDIVVQTPIVMLSAALVDASRLGGWLERGLLYVLAPLAAAFEHLLLSPNREFRADAVAAQACDSPHGLADALIRLEQAAELVEFAASPATEPLFTINPFDEDGLAGMFVSHPPVAKRVQRLRHLDPGWQAKLRAAQETASRDRFASANPYGHIDLRVRSMAEALPFYEALLPALGFTERFDGPEWKVFATNEPLPSAAYFGIVENPHHAANENRIAFWVGAPAEVDRLAVVVKSAGGREIGGPKPMPYGPDYYAVYFEDPCGNRFEIYHRLEG